MHNARARGRRGRAQEELEAARRRGLAFPVRWRLLAAVVLAVAVSVGGGALSHAGTGPGPSCPSNNGLVNTTPPVITGSITVGGTLTTSNGTWAYASDGSPVTPDGYAYNWYREATYIAGGQSYVVTSADVGHALHAHVAVYKGAGFCAGLVGEADSNTVAIDATDTPGPPSADQNEPTEDATDYGSPSAPTPLTPSGPAPAGSYSTDLWSPEETDSPSGLQVVTSTAAGTFALTGIVVNENTSDPVQGATVCLTNGTGTLGTITTSADGGFAFMNMPSPVAPDSLTLAVTSSGLGSYTLTNVSSDPDEMYQVTAYLDGSAQIWNDATRLIGPASAFTESTMSATNWKYPSNKYIPPSIRVAQYKLNSDCGPQRDAQGNAIYLGTHRFRWRYYILRVAAGEIKGSGWPGGYFKQEATKANMAAIQGYAWYRRHNSLLGPPYSGTGGASTAYDITNTNYSQCFVTGTVNTGVNSVPTPRNQWSKWIPDILATRITDGTSPGSIINAQYRGANPTHPCTPSDCDFYYSLTCQPNQNPPFLDPYFGAFATTPSPDPVRDDKTRFSQLGAKGAEERCGQNNETTGFLYDSWTGIVNYYYQLIGSVASGFPPPRPNNKSATVNSTTHSITFTFSSTVGTSPVQVAWRYNLVRYGDGSYVSLCCSTKATQSADDPVRTSFSYTPPNRGCYKYKVRASNPNGYSQFVDFNGGAQICP